VRGRAGFEFVPLPAHEGGGMGGAARSIPAELLANRSGEPGARIFQASIGSSSSFSGTGDGGGIGGEATVRTATLDQVLTAVGQVHLLRINEHNALLVLQSAPLLLTPPHPRVRYILFRLHPRRLSASHAVRLLELLPSIGAICFDLVGDHTPFPRPSSPVDAYLDALNGSSSSSRRAMHRARGGLAEEPWEDILCWFPGTERRSPMQQDRKMRDQLAFPLKDVPDPSIMRHFELRRGGRMLKWPGVQSYVKNNSAACNGSSSSLDICFNARPGISIDGALHLNTSVAAVCAEYEFSDLASAQRACLAAPWCTGVTKNAGGTPC